MSSFSTSLSGLDAEEQALSVISNDLSNLNTTAFKTGTPVFSDLFYQMLGTDGAGDPVQVGVGATMSSVDSPFTQGEYLHHGCTDGRRHPGKRALCPGSERHAGLHPRR